MDAQCINALPSVERGIVRDIFNPVKETPEPYTLDLVVEYSRFSQSQLSLPQQTPVKGTVSPSPSHSIAKGSTTSNASNSNGSDRFNCAPCKKSFGSEATWNSHQKSAKHIAAVKDAEKRAKGGRGGGGGGGSIHQKSNSSSNRSNPQETEMEPPEVAEALMSFRKVEKIAKENPGMAASVMWKISKVLWSHRYTQETAKVLTLLVQTLTTLQSSASPAAPVPGTLSPTQISMTLYLSRLALARLVVYQSPSVACQLYLDAIHGRWQINPADFQQMCEMVSMSSVTRLLDHCTHYLSHHSKTEKLMQSPTDTPASATAAAPAKMPDPNLKLLIALVESSSLLAQDSRATSGYLWESLGSGLSVHDRTHAEVAIVQSAMVVSLAQASLNWETVFLALQRMARVYQRLGMKHAAAACLLLSGQIFGTHRVVVNGTTQGDECLWDLLQALMLSLEMADFVRMQATLDLLEKCDHEEFRDIQVIMEVSRAVISQDNEFLHNNAALVFDHLSLLAQDPSANDLLLLSRKSASSSECSARLLRLQKLVS
ncbi:hypothetical protein BGZ82_004465 [Podila clonocystis]|nr:hypothetical protein BGZ82_004465 [Podila clonocystis]